MLENLMALSLTVINFLQTNLAFLTPIMRFFTFLGNEEFYLLIMPLFLWSLDYDAGIRLGLMLMTSGTLNTFMKLSFQQPRPYWVSADIQDLASPMGSFGLPSGHSQNAASVIGLLSTFTRHKWLKGTLYFTIVMIALSRLFLGVHSLADIVLGLTIGLFLLWTFLSVEEKIAKAFNGLTVLLRILIVFAISLALILLGVLINALSGDQSLPAVWVQNAHLAHPQTEISPYSLDGLVSSASVLFGLIAGSVWIKETGGYNAKAGSLVKHLLRFIIGIVGVIIIWKGLGGLFPRGEDLLCQCFRYLRYALVGLWIAGLAPKMFVALKLGERGRK